MRLAFLVAKALLEGDFASYFAGVPSAAQDPEPIVVREGAFSREALMDGEERGRVDVRVLVVRDEEAAAERDADACERWLRSFGWEAASRDGRWRVCGMDTTAPAMGARDGSGRYVCSFEVRLTVVRSL